MKTYPASLFPSLATSDGVCEPEHSALCKAAGIDPIDEKAGARAVDLDEAFQAVYGEACEDPVTAGDWFFVSDRHDSGYLISLGKGQLAPTAEHRLLGAEAH